MREIFGAIDYKKLNIYRRREIKAPSNYVSIFHETTSEYLPLIDKEGLIAKNREGIGSAEVVRRINKKIDNFRPNYLRELGISRADNIYAYPYLEYGNGFGRAARRFEKIDKDVLIDRFNLFKEYNPQYLNKLGVNTLDDFLNKMNSKEYLRSEYPRVRYWK